MKLTTRRHLESNNFIRRRRAEFRPSCSFLDRIRAQHPGHKLIILRKKITGLSPSTLERFVRRAKQAVRLKDTVNVLVTGNSEIRGLNRAFRGLDKATDVLSFPSFVVSVSRARPTAGDVAISLDIARENAARLGHSLADEVKILVLHGILHLAGFDHENDNGEMARKEIRLRQRLKLETGLIERQSIEKGSDERAHTPTERTSPRKTRCSPQDQRRSA